MAVFDDDARACLDRVPTFVQAVNPDFIQANEDALFSDFQGELLLSPWLDAALVLGFDGVFGYVPSTMICQSIEIRDEDGHVQKVDDEGRVSYPGTKYYQKGCITSMEILDRLRENTRVIDSHVGIAKVMDYAESTAPRLFQVPKFGGIFSRVWMAMGFREFSRHFLKHTRLYQELIKFRAEFLKKDLEGMIAATGKRAGAIFIADDIAYKGRPMIPPERFDADFAPYYKDILSMVIDAGILPLVHTDGDITSMVPSFQKVGFRGLQGWEGGCDPHYINEHFPDFAVIGFGDMNSVLPFGKRPEIEAHVRGLMNALKENRHFMIGPSSVVNATMPIENVRTFNEIAKKIGSYL
nr:hypothetical protein [Candidatus Sigynarchaeota archaeon]